ncbi:FHA domain-containing protein [Kitasatospora sp. NPDC094015]|uniref:FHA domain-containing protein n=1 Tax=Kitasatospora sp. NPDC094015 TaxID=3155205 RepID=UPI00331C861F
MADDLAALRRTERHLRGEAGRADYLVDLSNVVRDTALGGSTPRSLDRLRQVLRALRELTGDREVTVHAIADESLLNPRYDHEFPDPAQAPLLREWRDRGLIAALGTADPDLLDHAQVFGTPVISSDLFKGHRGAHPWIQGDREHFLGPERSGGRVRLATRDMRHFADQVVSREGERDALRARNLLDFRGRPRSDVLERSWHCPRPACHPGPAIRGGKVVCRSHGTLLTDAGPRRPRVQLKILVDGVCRAWENVTEHEGREFVLGRGNLGRIEQCHLTEHRLLTISRHHLLIVPRRGVLEVLDTSRARSRVRTLRPGGEPGPWKALPHRTGDIAGGTSRPRWRAFGPDDEIELVAGVVLRRSGQRWPGERPEGVRARPSRRPGDGGGLTRTG